MKKFLATVTSVGAGLLISSSALAAPGDGITGTAHDFSGIGTPATGLCTFCHTPHQALQQGLIWNHDLSVNNFSWTDPATTNGTTYPSFAGDTYRGVSAKCLSCHDGSVAIGAIAHWNGGDPGNLLNTNVAGVFQIGAGGNMDNNHPVAMPYPWNGAPSTYNGVTQDALIVNSGWVAQPELNGIRLFNDDGTGAISGGPVSGQTGIECASCHDPHNGPQVQDEWFLRGLLGGSTADYICVKCHDKG